VKHYINITGSFLKQGRVEIPAERPIDILDAIGLGGGFSPRADKNKIILRRKHLLFQDQVKRQLLLNLANNRLKSSHLLYVQYRERCSSQLQQIS
jgi:protein involved in polysaccharide export with SLBB domain